MKGAAGILGQEVKELFPQGVARTRKVFFAYRFYPLVADRFEGRGDGLAPAFGDAVDVEVLALYDIGLRSGYCANLRRCVQLFSPHHADPAIGPWSHTIEARLLARIPCLQKFTMHTKGLGLTLVRFRQLKVYSHST